MTIEEITELAKKGLTREERKELLESFVTRETLKNAMNISPEEEAKLIVVDAFRNGPLEDLHAKGRISDDEMKGLMKHAVDQLNFWMWMALNCPKNYVGRLGLMKEFGYITDWDPPKDPEQMYNEQMELFKQLKEVKKKEREGI